MNIAPEEMPREIDRLLEENERLEEQLNEEWGTPISKDKIIYRRNKLVELAKVEAKPYTIWHETINENLLDINYMIYEIERLHSIIKEAREYIEWHYDLATDENVEFCLLRDRVLGILDKESK